MLDLSESVVVSVQSACRFVATCPRICVCDGSVRRAVFGADGGAELALQAPAAHRGFWQRTNAVPIESIYELACSRSKRLVITGCDSLAAAKLKAAPRQRQVSIDGDGGYAGTLWAERWPYWRRCGC